MAIAPPRLCGHPKCRTPLHCTQHQAAPWRTLERPSVHRIRGRELQRRRARLFARQPWCVLCLKDGKYTRPTIRDHIVPLAEGGTEDASNEQAICQTCSDQKTHREAQRGLQRQR